MAKLLTFSAAPATPPHPEPWPSRHPTANQPLADGAVLARNHRTAREEPVRARESREPQVISKIGNCARGTFDMTAARLAQTAGLA